MLNTLLYFSVKNEKPFGDVNTIGTFACLLKRELNKLNLEYTIKKIDSSKDILFIGGKKICLITGYSSVYKIKKEILKKLKIDLINS